MRKKKERRLQLHRETLHRLENQQLGLVHGQDDEPLTIAPRCNTMRCDFTDGCESDNNTCAPRTFTCTGFTC